MQASSFYTPEELKKIGFKKIGKNVLISRKASIYSLETVIIGNNVRIDDFCIISGKIKIGNYIHISAHTALYGGAGIYLEDFSTLSGRVSVYSVSDDYSGQFLTNPMIPIEFRNVIAQPVYIKKHVIVGAGTVILPGVKLHEGASIGAMSLVKDDMPAWTICAGIPAKPIKERSKEILDLEKLFLKKLEGK